MNLVGGEPAGAAAGSVCARVAAVLVVTALAAHAQPSGSITGTVQDATGLSLVGATITVQGASNRTALTNDAGAFRVENLPDGEYQISATLAGFVPARVAVRVEPGGTPHVTLTLAVQHVEQTIVTASRVGESLVQATPMAVSVMTARDLAATQAHTIGQLWGLIPSFTFSQNNDFAQPTIRGIGSNVVFAGSDPSSAVYIDGVYLARPVMVLTEFLDLERIEVLRGPQGTLYGRNAVGGAINLVTRPPSRHFQVSGEFTAGTYGAWRTQARVSGPLASPRILASAAILRGVRRGFVADLNHPDHPLGGEDVTAVRGQMLMAIGPKLGVLLSADSIEQDPTPLTYAKVLTVKPGFQIDNPSELHDVRASTMSTSRIAQHGGSARVMWTMTPSMTVTSLSAFRTVDYELFSDADITELELLTSHVHETQHQFSEELTVTQTRGALTWLGGLFLFDETDRQPTIVGLGGPRLVNWLLPRVGAHASALFGQATMALWPRVSVTAGLRYSDESKTIDNAGRLTTMDPPQTVVSGSAYSYSDFIAYNAWTPRVAIDVRASHNTLAYVSAARGFKSGGFNLTSTEPGRGYHPELVWSFEGGVKTELAKGRARLTLAAFDTDYRDLQVQTPISPGVLDISNAAAATIRGVEVEGSLRLVSSARAGGHLAWLDARYDQYVAVGPGGVTADVAGRRLSNAPEWSGHVWSEWTPSIGADSLSMRADLRWQSTVFFTPFNDAIQRQEAYGILDLGVQFQRRAARWSLAAYARNVTNQGYITGSFSSPPPAIGGRPGEPRHAGVELKIER
jgi:iron complex outermembrane receptor protein